MKKLVLDNGRVVMNTPVILKPIVDKIENYFGKPITSIDCWVDVEDEQWICANDPTHLHQAVYHFHPNYNFVKIFRITEIQEVHDIDIEKTIANAMVCEENLKMKIYKIDFEPIYPVPSVLIINAYSEENAKAIAMRKFKALDIQYKSIEEIKIDEEGIIAFESGEY